MSQDKIFLNFLESIDTETVTSNINNNTNNTYTDNIIDSITSELNLTGGMSAVLSTTSQNTISSNKLNKLLNSTSNINKNMSGGNNVDVDKLLSMLTTESSSELQTITNKETSTETLENQLKQILTKNNEQFDSASKNNEQYGGACTSCGHHIKNNDIRRFFTNLKSKGVKVDVKLNNQSMTEYFDDILQTTTDINTQDGGDDIHNLQDSGDDINTQDGGANNKFTAAQAVRKDIAKEFNISNGKEVVKIAFAVVKAVVEKTPSLANDADALSKAVKKHFEENKAHFKRML
jgi:hypothetical protein